MNDDNEPVIFPNPQAAAPVSTRPVYRDLTRTEEVAMKDVKFIGQAFLDHIEELRSTFPDAGRELALARTNLEQAVMWACKGITNER